MARDVTCTAAVLAGSRPGGDPFARSQGADLKTLIAVNGEPMIVRPVRALLRTDGIAAVIVLAQELERLSVHLPDDPRIALRRSQGSIAETICSLMSDPTIAWPLLVTTADHALLEPSIIEEFCEASKGADVAIGVVERETLLNRFPRAKRTWLRFRGGAYTGANLFSLASPAVAPAVELWRSIEQDRKKAWRVLSVLGPFQAIGAVLRVSSLDQLLEHLGRRLGLTMRAVRLSNPLAGVDVDKASDLELVEAILAQRQ